ncbi:MAG: bifunctional riboflavin kinase/FAD synthetase [Lachnospiraceae bacterium]|jgi:riboflavin kinase/FMN adenylyltransferase|nr:bifunctional riboflavin kinase/FAD synthetase [Lachnospiraceae bacterium]
MEYLAGTACKTELCRTNTAVTLGKFDGIHLGHQRLLAHILGQSGLTSVMFTFDLHPGNLFSDQEIKLIETQQERIHYLEQTGLDVLIAYPFTKETASMEARQFVRQILSGQLGARRIVVGEDFCFGRHRLGTVALLQEMAEECGYELIVCPKVIRAGKAVSSTRIRSLIEEGRMEEVSELLGRPFSVEGTVINGNRLGHTVGMPTANLRPEETKLLPPNGVYVADFTVKKKTYRGITNIGYKPTIGGETAPGVETWIFDFDEDIYGQEVKVELLQFVRPERKFASLEAVKAQVEQDAGYARAWKAST